MKKKKKTINAMNICERAPTQRNPVMFEGMMNMLVTGNARYMTLTECKVRDPYRIQGT